MVDFVEKFDFITAVRPHIEEVYDQATPLEDEAPKIIGQERNGIVLFTWHSKGTADGEKRKTHVSLYDTTKQSSILLFTHNDDIDIVNASVNQDNILLAFTVREKQSIGGQTSPGDPCDIFKSYIAEIAPNNRVFSLNIEWHTYQKVQFIYSAKPSPKRIHMLFIHHKESIGLYHIPVGKLGDAGFIMSSQPKTEQIVRQFLWCQFDPTYQRLYFVQLKSQDEEGSDAAAMFNIIQFNEPGEYKYMMNFPLPISFKMELMKETVKYFGKYLSQTVSNRNLNMEVLTSPKGELAVCYQQASDEICEKSTDSENDDNISVCSMIPGNNTIEYLVCCLHGSYTIRTVVSIRSRGPMSSEARLIFSYFGDYVMVFLPGEFIHLLDCSSEHKPMHHILLSEDGFSRLPGNSENVLLSQVNWDYVSPSQHGTLFFENNTQKTYKAVFSHKLLLQIFSKTRQSATRLAVLHSAIVHIKDAAFAKKLVEYLCQDPANMECTELLKEYLIAYAYANMKRLLSKRYLLKALPLSCSEPFRGQMERDRDSDRAVILTYKKFRREIVDVLLGVLRGRNTDYWSLLKENIMISQDDNVKRFPIKQLVYASLQINQQHTSTVPFARKMLSAKDSLEVSQSSKRDKMAANPHSDDTHQVTLSDIQSWDETLMQVVIEKISTHMLQCFPRENKGKVHNISLEYASCRGKVAKSLWRHISKVLNYNSEVEVLKAPLKPTTESTDFALFQILERLHFCVAQLSYPEFRDMSNVFISLAYRCLPVHLFMQYLNASVFTVKADFVQRFVTEVPDEEHLIPVKIELVSRLPKQQAKACLINWDHPIAKRYITQELVNRFDGEDVSIVGNVMSLDRKHSNDQESERFLPLETFLRAIKNEDRHFGSHRLTDEELDFIESTALTHMDFLSIAGYKD